MSIRPLRRVATGLVFVMLAASCSGSAPEIPEADATDAVPSDETGSATTRSGQNADADAPADAASIVLSSETTLITTRADLDEAGQAWVAMWRLVHDQASLSELRSVATESGSAFLETDLQLGTLGVSRSFNLYPTSTTNDDGSVTLDDCVLASPSLPGGNVGLHLRALVETDADGDWLVTSTEAVSRDGCVPGVLATESLAAYEAYWDAHVVFWNPADPLHPSLADVAAGDHLDRMTALLVQFEGFEFRGRPETHPEVIEYGTPDQIVIADCQLTDPDWGIYDPETGFRTADLQPTFDGRLDGRLVTMTRIDGSWRVTSRQGSENIECEFAPTSAGLPLI